MSTKFCAARISSTFAEDQEAKVGTSKASLVVCVRVCTRVCESVIDR